MFDYIKGQIVNKKVDSVSLDINGIGYKIHISLNTFEKIKEKECKLYIYNYIREDAYILYGFYDESEREFFEKLLSVSGVGTLQERPLR
jgi:Holliday junction DNA helicase RuvA